MGIPRLMKLLQAHAKSALKNRRSSEFKGKYLAVDTMQIVYKTAIAIRNKGSDLTRSSDGKITSHLHGLFYHVKGLLSNNIIPICVFDGAPPDIKKDALNQRKDRKKRSIEELKKLKQEKDPNDAEIIKHFKRTFGITGTMIRECKKLLDYLGVPYVQAPGEADSQSSALAIAKSTNVHGVISEDMDHLPFGAPYLLRNFSHKQDIIEINLGEILRKLDLTHKEFIDLCILIGTEYCPTIKGLGPETAYLEYKKFKDIPKLLIHLKKENGKNVALGKKVKYHIPVNYLEKYEKAKKYYLDAQVKSPDKINTQWNTPQRDALIEFLVDENEFKRSHITNHIDELLRIYNSFVMHGGYRPKSRFSKKNQNTFPSSFSNYRRKIHRQNKYNNKYNNNNYNNKYKINNKQNYVNKTYGNMYRKEIKTQLPVAS